MEMHIYTIIGSISAIVGIIWFLWSLYDKMFPFKKLSWKFAEKKAQEITSNIIKENFSPTLIVGIGRGGAILGAVISGCLGHRPLLVIDREYKWNKNGRIEDIIFPVNVPSMFLERILLVAGEMHSGGTMKLYYDYFKSLGAKEIKKAVLFFEEGCPINADYIGLKSSRKNIRMPWMFTKNYIRADRKPLKSIQFNEKDEIIVYLIRHGETKYDEEDRFCGISDPDLTLKGIEQSIFIKNFFENKDIKIEKIYTSNRKRAIETAKIVQSINYSNYFPEIIIDDRLNEMNFGKWEGLPRAEIKIKFKKEYEQWVKDPLNHVAPDGESPKDVLDRVLDLLKNLEESFKTVKRKNVVCITHKTPIRVLLCHINNLPLSTYREFKIGNGKMVTLVYDGKRWRIEGSNRYEQ